MVEVAIDGPVPRLELVDWRDQFGILAGITRRGDGDSPFDLSLGGTAGPVGAVLNRWRGFRRSVPGFSGVVVSHQVHGTVVSWHHSMAGLVIDGDGDGHATATPGTLLAVTAADCVPVYLADPVAGVGVFALLSVVVLQQELAVGVFDDRLGVGLDFVHQQSETMKVEG